MKIATWNVDRVRPGTGARTSRIRAAISSIPADIWVLTETHSKFQLSEVYELVASSSAAADRGPDECWVSIWVRRSLHATRSDVSGEPNRSASVLVPGNAKRDLLVFGTVLPWRGDTATAERGANKFVKSLGAQAKDWARVSDPARPTDICIAGDFNQEVTANGPVGTLLGRAALNQVLEVQKLTCVTSGDRDPLKKWRASIDHIVLSTQSIHRVRGSVIWPNQYPIPTNMPDHHGVCVELADT